MVRHIRELAFAALVSEKTAFRLNTKKDPLSVLDIPFNIKWHKIFLKSPYGIKGLKWKLIIIPIFYKILRPPRSKLFLWYTHSIYLPLILQKMLWKSSVSLGRGAGLVQRWERSPSTNVSRVLLPGLGVICRLSTPKNQPLIWFDLTWELQKI